MESQNTVSLRLDIYEKDAKNILQWLNDKDVTKYLNEDVDELFSLQEIIRHHDSNLLTYYLNQDGRFFLIDQGKECLGFINLFTILPQKEYEVVIVIGEEYNWGKGYGLHALEKCMNEVFFSWRINKLNAHIYLENERSNHMFIHAGFKVIKKSNKFYTYSISFEEYLDYLKKVK